MKKLLSLLLAASLCCGSAWALAADYTQPGFFTVSYDDKAFALDTENADAYTDDAVTVWLGKLSDGNVTFEFELDKLENTPHLDFTTAPAEARQAYADQYLDDNADEDAQLVTEMTGAKENLPFLVFSLRDEEGLYYTAQTVLNGTAVNLYCYYEDRDPDDALMDILEAMVDSFAVAK